MYPIKYAIVLLITCISSQLLAQNWEIEEGYEITFSGKKAEGSFQGLTGRIRFDPFNLSNSQFNVSLDVNSIETGNNTKNKHARSENWFYAKSFPKINFNSKSVSKTSAGYVVVGELELRGATKEVSLPFSFQRNNEQGEFKGTLTLNRKDFGIEGNFMEFLVGDQFEVSITVPVVRSATD